MFHFEEQLTFLHGKGKSDVVLFFATDYTDVLNSPHLSFSGSLDPHDKNALWINGIQSTLDGFFESRGWKTFMSGLAIAFFAALILCVLWLFSWFVNIFITEGSVSASLLDAIAKVIFSSRFRG